MNYVNRSFGRYLAVILCLWANARFASAQTPVFNAVNGHYYERVFADLTWRDAREAAADRVHMGLPGYLATITSESETDFLVENLPDLPQESFWLGGFQDVDASDFSEPGGGWRWITGEPFEYTNWGNNQPNENNNVEENFLETRHPTSQVWTWNDLTNHPDVDGEGGAGFPFNNGFIVEYGLTLDGDFNLDGELDGTDINQLANQIATDRFLPFFDLNADSAMNWDDIDLWHQLNNTLNGDANLDGEVAFNDFLALSTSFGSMASWTEGDFDGSGDVQFPDFLILSSNFGKKSGVANAVPEPNSLTCLLLGFAMLLVKRRRRQPYGATCR